jgi:hypothetical protein
MVRSPESSVGVHIVVRGKFTALTGILVELREDGFRSKPVLLGKTKSGSNVTSSFVAIKK